MLFGQLHLQDGFAIALGMGAAEVARAAFFVRSSLLVPHHQHLVPIEPGETGADGPVVAIAAVAVQLDELLERQRQIVRRIGPVLVPGDLHDLPRSEIGIDVPRPLSQLAAELSQQLLLLRRAVGRLLNRPPTRIELQQRLLEIEPWGGGQCRSVSGHGCLARTL